MNEIVVSLTAFNMTISASFKKNTPRFFSERIHAPADSFISKNEGMNQGLLHNLCRTGNARRASSRSFFY
jgi:hypothetical protein